MKNNGVQRKTGYLVILSSLLLGINAAWVYSTRVVLPDAQVRMDFEALIVSGEADSPWKYRFAVPLLAQHLSDFFERTDLSAIQVHLLSHLVINSIAAAGILFFAARIAELSNFRDLLLVQLFIYVGLNIALYDHMYAPWSLVEMLLWLVALFVIRKKQLWFLTLVIPALALVRETGLLLGIVILLLLFFEGSDWKSKLRTALPAAVGLGMGLIVQLLVRGLKVPKVLGLDITPVEILTINSSATGLRQFAFNLVLMIGIPILSLLAVRSRAAFLEWEYRVLLAMTPYFAVFFSLSIWYEVRGLGVSLPLIAIIAVKALTRSLPASPKSQA